MFRRVISLLLLLMMMLPAALAESTPVYQVSTFSGRLPEELLEPLAALIPDESRILSGAAIRHNGYHIEGDDSPANPDCLSALVLVNADDGLRLYAAAQPEGLPWEVSDYTRFLRQGKNVSVGVYQPEPNRIPVFSVDYGVQGGTMSDLFVYWNNQLWCMKGHINTATGFTISNYPGSLTITDGQTREDHACADAFWLDYMDDLSAFPTSWSDIPAIDDALGAAATEDAAASIVYAGGAHLRQEPTGKSESLGVYANNVPMIFTGESKQGTTWPWYQVRIGNTVGWMSSNYVKHAADYGFGPVPMGRIVEDCPLYGDPSDKQASVELPAGATFHILTEHKGMYHVCIPRGEISCAVDVDGIYGYIPKEGVLTGVTPTALDALENR